MKKIASFFAITFILCFLLQAVNVFAAEPCYVYINNQLLTFDDATPQIMNNRAMVPFRKTAETLGATIDWNSKTETMTLTKGSRTVVHTLRSNIITVNGEAVTFDTRSAVLQSRTMMPVRMLAEALGATVDWDNATRRVLITTESSSISNVYADKNLIKNGETATITVNATASTERVKMVDTATNTLIAESVVYSQNADNSRTFTMQYTPSVTISEVKTLKFSGGNAVEYNESDSASKLCMISVTVNNTPSLVKVELSDRSVKKNDYVELSIYTNAAADRVKILNNFKGTGTELTTYNLSGDERVFQTKIKMTEKGDCELYIYPGTADGYEANYQTESVSVGGSGSTSSSSDDDELEITDVDYDSDVAVGEDATVTITTTYDIVKVEIYDDDDDKIVKKNFPTTSSKSDNEKTWKVQFTVKSSGKTKYTVKAYNEDDDSTSEKFNLSGERYNSDELAILSVTQKSDNVGLNENVRMVAKTTEEVEYIIVKDSYSNEVAKVESSSGSGSSVTWNFDVKVEKESRNDFTIYAYDKNGSSVTKKFKVTLDVADAPEINDIEVDEKTVDEGDEINVTVYTNDAVSKIWIEDESGHKVSKSKKNPDDEDDDEYIWEFSFDAEDDKGRYTYYVHAENDDGDEDEMSFTIKVVD